MIGVGFGLSQTVIPTEEIAYINTLYVHLIECGYFSIAVWAVMLIYMFRKGDTEVRTFLILYSIMMIFTGMGRPMMICYFFSFLLAQSRAPLIDTKSENTNITCGENTRITDMQEDVL